MLLLPQQAYMTLGVIHRLRAEPRKLANNKWVYADREESQKAIDS